MSEQEHKTIKILRTRSKILTSLEKNYRLKNYPTHALIQQCNWFMYLVLVTRELNFKYKLSNNKWNTNTVSSKENWLKPMIITYRVILQQRNSSSMMRGLQSNFTKTVRAINLPMQKYTSIIKQLLQ